MNQETYTTGEVLSYSAATLFIFATLFGYTELGVFLLFRWMGWVA